MPRPSCLDLDECTRLANLTAELESAGKLTIDVDREFHLLLYRSLNNSLVNNLIGVFRELYRRLGGLPPAEHHMPVAPLHLAIVEAQRIGDADLTMKRMREHFIEVRLRSQAHVPGVEGLASATRIGARTPAMALSFGCRPEQG